MTDEEYRLVIEALITQGVVRDEAEAVRRLRTGEKLEFKCQLDAETWRGIEGVSE